MRIPFFWSSATEGVPGKPFPVPHRGCPEDWGFDIALPRQRIALLGHKKAIALRWLFCGPNRA